MFITKQLHVQCSVAGEKRNVKVSVAATTTKSVGETRGLAGEARRVMIKEGLVILKRNSLYPKRLGVSKEYFLKRSYG